MSRASTWKGFDYKTHAAVELPRDEWKARIAKATRTLRAAGDLLIFEGARIVAEVYDREPSAA